jgi:hypothetical protein
MATVGERRSAVSFYPTDHPALNITVKNRLSERVRNMQVDLAYTQDWPDFKFRVGKIEGLTEAIAMCDEVLTEMAER